MKKSETRFLKNGFYGVEKPFPEKDLMFVTGEPVGVAWIDGLCHIAKTGEESGKANILEEKNASKLRKLTQDEIFRLTGGKVTYRKAFGSMGSFIAACNLFDDRKKLV